MKMLIRIVVLICLSLPLSAIGAGEKVKIGVIYGDSPWSGTDTQLELIGPRFAIEDLNRIGGLLGRQIELVELDNHNSALGSKQAAQKAVEAGVIAVIGPVASSHSVVAGAVLQKAQIPMISPFAINSEVTLMGDYIFRINFSDRTQGQALAHFAFHDLKAKTAVVLTCPEEKFSLGLSEIFKTFFKENGGAILWEGEYMSSATDFEQLLKKASSFHPNVIFLSGYERASGFIIRQSRNMGENVTFLGGNSWTDNLYKYGGDAIEGCFHSGPWFPDRKNVTSREFIDRYKDSFRNEQILLLALSHDAVFLLADAVRRADSLDPASIRTALATTTGFQGITGTISMDRNGDPAKPISIFKYENGGSVFVKTVTP